MNLQEGQPRLIDETLKIVEWNVRFDILPEVQVYRKDTNQVYPITDFDTRGLIRDVQYTGLYAHNSQMSGGPSNSSQKIV